MPEIRLVVEYDGKYPDETCTQADVKRALVKVPDLARQHLDEFVAAIDKEFAGLVEVYGADVEWHDPMQNIRTELCGILANLLKAPAIAKNNARAYADDERKQDAFRIGYLESAINDAARRLAVMAGVPINTETQAPAAKQVARVSA